MKTFAEQLDQFVERGAEKHPIDLNYRIECADFTCGAVKSWGEGYDKASASLKPIVLKLYGALGDCIEGFEATVPDFWDSPLGKKLEKGNAEVSKMIEGGSK